MGTFWPFGAPFGEIQQKSESDCAREPLAFERDPVNRRGRSRVRSRNRQIARLQVGFATFCRETGLPERRTGFYELSWSRRIIDVGHYSSPARSTRLPTPAVYLAGCHFCRPGGSLRQGCATCTSFPRSFTAPAELGRPGREGIAFSRLFRAIQRSNPAASSSLI
jgi:hypothetical protein